jgi:structural maintenance of chromosome 4
MREKFRKQMNREFIPPEKSQRLFDLVQTSDDYREAFFFALKNTLVCEDLNIGTDVAFNKERRHRVVTLQGELIEQSGTMSAGGKPKQGMMRISSGKNFSPAHLEYTKEQIEAFEEEIRQLKEIYYKSESDLASLNDDLSKCKDKIDKRVFETERAKYAIDEKTYIDEIAKIEEVSENYEKILNDEEEMKTLESLKSKIDAKDVRIKELEPNIENLVASINGCENEILDVGGNDYRKVKKEYEEVYKKQELSTSLINKTKGNIDFTTKEIEQFSQNLQEKQNEIQRNASGIEVLKKQLEELDKKASEVLAKFESAKAKKEETNKSLEGRKQEFDDKKKSLDKLEAEKRDLTDKYTDAQQKKRR